jgi:hypothetical protein
MEQKVLILICLLNFSQSSFRLTQIEIVASDFHKSA